MEEEICMGILSGPFVLADGHGGPSRTSGRNKGDRRVLGQYCTISPFRLHQLPIYDAYVLSVAHLLHGHRLVLVR